MRILVTAGNTQTPLDAVRCITNIFTGRTGAAIAQEGYERGHSVTLLTSHPELQGNVGDSQRWRILPYRTFDDLQQLLHETMISESWDAVIHCAAVSDFALAEVCTMGADGKPLSLPASGKIKSTHAELWLKLVPTPKLIDQFRHSWGFRGLLVKFKLEVDVSEAELIAIGQQSRAQSDADWLVANTLAGYNQEAFLIDRQDHVTRLQRADLPKQLFVALEGQSFAS